MADETKILLAESEIPTHWTNLMPDLPGAPAPPLRPDTLEPAGPDDLSPIFPMGLIQQEVSAEPEIEIPDEVRDIYKLWRPTPLLRARRLERELDTPAHLYYKYEGTSPAGSHKPNTAVPQAYYNKQEGIERLATETGAGPVGLGAGARLPPDGDGVRRVHGRLELRPEAVPALDDGDLGRDRAPQPLGPRPSAGRAQAAAPDRLARDRDLGGGRGRRRRRRTNYALGSVLNHVLLHQTVIGQESIAQMEKAGEYPDTVIGCVGGGSNFAGIAIPFVRANLRDGKGTRFIACEPAACPTLTRGVYRYDFGDTMGMTPLMPMYTLGHDFVPPPVHAGGLRYHGDAPLVCGLVKEGLVEARAFKQNETFEAAVRFARTEGIIPAPEPAHAIRAVIDEALAAREAGEERVILFNLCGHGHFDLAAYDAYLAGKLEDPEFSEEEMEAALARLPETPALA